MKEATDTTNFSMSRTPLFAHSISVSTILFSSYIDSTPLPVTIIALTINFFIVNFILNLIKK